jgi:hypothetical protein
MPATTVAGAIRVLNRQAAMMRSGSAPMTYLVIQARGAAPEPIAPARAARDRVAAVRSPASRSVQSDLRDRRAASRAGSGVSVTQARPLPSALVICARGRTRTGDGRR